MIEYVRTNALKVGDQLARGLYDGEGKILLREGNSLTQSSIRTIREKGYKGCYIYHAGYNKREEIQIAEPIIDDLTVIRIIAVIKQLFEVSHRVNIFDNPYNKEFGELLHMLDYHLDEVINILSNINKEGKLLLEMEDGRVEKNWIYYHSFTTCTLAICLGLKMRLPKESIKNISLGALFHDLGKSEYPELISKINISDKERELLREHPEKMFRVLQKWNLPLETTYSVWMHHEYMNGEGYPHHVSGASFPLSARIVALASKYDNLVSKSPYNTEPMTQEEALERLGADERYDNELVRELYNVVAPYPVGCKVKIAGAIPFDVVGGDVHSVEGIVIKNNASLPLRPTVLVGRKQCDLASDEKFRAIVVAKRIS